MLPGNIPLWKLLHAAELQWRIRTVGAHGFVVSELHGLDMGAVAAMAPAFGLRQNQILFEKLRIFERECLLIWSGNRGCTEKKKEGCRVQHGKHLKWACANCPDKKTV